MLADKLKHMAKKHLSLILRVGVTILACWWVARGMDFSEVSGAFGKISTWAWLTVIGVFIFSQVLLALRWWLFMRAWDIYVDFWSTIKLTFLGLYFNNCLPGSVGGDLVRAWYVAQHNPNRRMDSIISVFVDRALALLGTFIIAITAFLCMGKSGIFTRQDKSGISNISSQAWWFFFVIAGAIALTGLGMLIVPAGRKLFKSLYETGLRYGKKAISQSFQAGMVLLKKPYLLPESLALTFILQSLVVLSLWLLGRQMGIPADWKLYFVFFPVMWVVGSIPISVAGIGIVEGGLIVLFTKFGSASHDTATALALSQRIVWIVTSIPGLVVYLSGKHLPKDIIEQFSVDEKKTIQ
jgi:uncharacterized protein (TIRG00374 family)